MRTDVATAADASALAALVNAAYRGLGGVLGWTNEADLFAGGRAGPEEVAALIEEEDATVLLRRGPDGGLVGCVAIELEPVGAATISMLAVDPRQQASGLGRDLLAEAERIALEAGAQRARMTVVEPRTELIAWYERRGYRRTGDHEAFSLR